MIAVAIIVAIIGVAAAAQRWPRATWLATVWAACRVASVLLYAAAILGAVIEHAGEALQSLGREFGYWSREAARALASPPAAPVQSSNPAGLSTDAGLGLDSGQRTDPRLEPEQGRPAADRPGTLEWYVWSACRGEQDTQGAFEAYAAAHQHHGIRHVGRSTFFTRVRKHKGAIHAWTALHGDLGAPVVVVRDRTGEGDGVAIV